MDKPKMYQGKNPILTLRIKPEDSRRRIPTEFVVRMDEQHRINIPKQIRDWLMVEPRQPLRLSVEEGHGFFCELVTISEVEEFLVRYKLTYAEMQDIWEFLYEYSEIVKDYTDQGYNWTDFSMVMMRSILRKYADLLEEARINDELLNGERKTINEYGVPFEYENEMKVEVEED